MPLTSYGNLAVPVAIITGITIIMITVVTVIIANIC